MAETPSEKDTYLRELNEHLRYSASKFDGQTLAISGGALGVSLTFIKDIVPFQSSVYSWLFYTAQIFFIVSITLGFISHYISLKATESNIKKANAGDFSGILLDNVTSNKKIKRCNLWIVRSLPLGIFLLVLYCFINIEIYETPEVARPKEEKEVINDNAENRLKDSTKVQQPLKNK